MITGGFIPYEVQEQWDRFDTNPEQTVRILKDMVKDDNKYQYPVHKEDFDVVLIKNGVSDLSAKPEDFKRVLVQEVADPIAALTHDSVTKIAGYRPMFAMSPGVMSGPEMLARRRLHDNMDSLDKSKI